MVFLNFNKINDLFEYNELNTREDLKKFRKHYMVLLYIINYNFTLKLYIFSIFVPYRAP